MPVVKAQQKQVAHQSAIVMDLTDLERQATTIVSTAKKQAAAILADARAQAEADSTAIREAARQAGHNEGRDAGFAEGMQKGHDEAVAQAAQGLANLVARWSATLEEFQSRLPTHLADAKTDLVRLALAIAARVAKMEAMRDRQVVTGNVEAALALVTAGRTVAVQLHPDELAVLEGYLPALTEKFRQIQSIDLEPDPAITPGGCTLRYGAGQIDATLETQVQRIADELLARQE